MIDPSTPPQCSPWGKYRAHDNASHHLAHHCADVAACFLALACLPVIRVRLERAAGRPLSPVVLERLAVIAFLHDAGKLHPGFQAKGWPSGIWKAPHAGHVREGVEIFCSQADIARNLCLEELHEWGLGENGALLFAAISHHGRPVSTHDIPTRRWSKATGGAWEYDPVAASAEMGRMIRSWFPLAFEASDKPLPDATAFQHLFCGLVSLADWIGSDSETFKFIHQLDPGYMPRVRALAEKTIANRRIDVEAFRPPIAGRTDFRAVTGFETPREHQRLIGEAPLDEQLVILEAETGSGKTEAALWRFIRLFEAGKVDSLYFALPTRAAAIQLHARVNEALKRLFGENTLEAALAVPGYIKAGETQGQPLPDWRVMWDDDPDEERRQARWAAESAKRYLAAAVAVGTVDQAMLAGLQVKHAHVRGAALSRSLLVVDEIHASDAYMTGVLSHLLKTHLGWGGHAMLMSATLGSIARCKWLGAAKPPAFDEAAATPYPAVWLKSESYPLSPERDEAARQKRVTMRIVESMAADGAATEAMAAARSGARVLVIRNTVDTAIATWQAVRNQGGEDLLLEVAGGPALHHSRFAAEDRKLLDKAVENALSPKLRQPGGVIVVGTQTLEQSLDIDADILLTDLCPVDVLLQRIGRLHRHSPNRPQGFEIPQCMVMTPENGLAPLLAPAFENGLGAWKENNVYVGVYTDLCVLELTRRLIVEHPHWTIPEMNRLLVESATHPERIQALHAELGKDWFDYWMHTYGKDVADAGAAKGVALPIRATFGETEARFASDEEKIRTRLGAEGARIEFAEAVEGPFGKPISSITLPSHWSHGIDGKQRILPIRINTALELSFEKFTLLYDRRGLTKTSR